jgi:hypothetical protein
MPEKNGQPVVVKPQMGGVRGKETTPAKTRGFRLPKSGFLAGFQPIQ